MELLRGGTVQERMAQDSTFSEGQCSRITSHVVSVGGRVRDNLCEYIFHGVLGSLIAFQTCAERWI